MASRTMLSFVTKTALWCLFCCATVKTLDCVDTLDAITCNDYLLYCAGTLLETTVASLLSRCQKTCEACNDNQLLLAKTTASPPRFFFSSYQIAPLATDGLVRSIITNETEKYFTLPRNCYRSEYDDPPKNLTGTYRFLCIDAEKSIYIENLTLFLASQKTKRFDYQIEETVRDHTIIYTSLNIPCDNEEGRYQMINPSNLCQEKEKDVPYEWSVKCQNPGYRRYILIIKPSAWKHVAICEVYIGGGPWRCSMGFYEVNNTCTYCSLRCNGSRCLEVDTCPQCPDRMWGKVCGYNCSDHCKDGRCDRWSGVCLKGCSEKRWSVNCSKTCLKCGYSCEQDTGKCHNNTCIPGYWNSSGDCTGRCPINCAGWSCDSPTGYCEGCIRGYYGPRCVNKCPSTCPGGSCRNGSCDACPAGFYGDNCNIQCPSNCFQNACRQKDGQCLLACPAVGKYGPNCSLSCSPNCKDNRCEKTSGDCIFGCNQGFFTINCSVSCVEACRGGICLGNDSPSCPNDSCSESYFGYRCERKCPDQCLGKCSNYGNSFTCPRCRDGMAEQDCSHRCPENCVRCHQNRTHDCSECKLGRFGVSCEGECPASCRNSHCFQNGTCQTCSPGRWGQHCDLYCSNCNQLECGRYTGKCSLGCVDGFYGQLCNGICPENCIDRVCNPAGDCRIGCEDDFEGPTCNRSPTTFFSRNLFVLLLYLFTGVSIYIVLFFFVRRRNTVLRQTKKSSAAPPKRLQYTQKRHRKKPVRPRQREIPGRKTPTKIRSQAGSVGVRSQVDRSASIASRTYVFECENLRPGDVITVVDVAGEVGKSDSKISGLVQQEDESDRIVVKKGRRGFRS